MSVEVVDHRESLVIDPRAEFKETGHTVVTAESLGVDLEELTFHCEQRLAEDRLDVKKTCRGRSYVAPEIYGLMPGLSYFAKLSNEVVAPMMQAVMDPNVGPFVGMNIHEYRDGHLFAAHRHLGLRTALFVLDQPDEVEQGGLNFSEDRDGQIRDHALASGLVKLSEGRLSHGSRLFTGNDRKFIVSFCFVHLARENLEESWE